MFIRVQRLPGFRVTGNPDALTPVFARPLLCLVAVAMLLAGSPAVARVVIQGVNDDIANAIRAGLSLPANCDESDWLVRYRFRNSKTEIETTLQTFGYYSPTISRQLTFGPSCWEARFQVDTGPPALIARARVAVRGEGAGFEAFRQVLSATPVRQGDRFDQADWQALKSDIENIAGRFGFRDGKFAVHEARVDVAHNKVDVDLVYDTGPRFHFGDVTFNHAGVNDAVLRRYLPFHRGDPFDAQKLARFYQSLLDSGYFSDVMIDSSHMSGRAIEVKVDCTPGRRSRSRIGIGYSTDFGPGLTVGREVQRVNRRGHKLKADFSESPVQTKFTGEYRIPRMEDKDAWISVYGGYLGEHTDTSKTGKSTIGVRRVIPRRNGWVETPFLEVTNDRSEVSGVSSSNLTIVPGVDLSHTYTDSVTGRPQHAHSFSVDLSGTSTKFGSSIDYLKATAGAKVIQALTGRIRFIGRGRVGAVWSNDFTRLPADVRFFTGGDNSVRGYDYNEIGAVDASGNVVGGDRIIEGSTEFDFQFLPHWAFATFFDAGSVSLSSFSGTFERSAGIGIRWYSPIGPVRVDLAQPLNAPGRGIKLHISLGPDL